VSSFSSQFQAHIVPSDSEVAEAMRQGFIVLDTNVLLSAYRFAPKAREELLSVLEKIRGRAWIPYQVGLEFHKNRFEVIAEHDAAYRDLLEALAVHRKTIESDLESKIRQLSNRSALTDDERNRLIGLSRKGLASLQREIERLHESHGLSQPTESDGVLGRLQAIFTDHVGPPFAAEEVREAEREATRRVEQQIPPGYKDSGKANAYGDYFLWAQTLAEAARRKPKFVIFVTGDVKEDWYLRVKGKTIIGRPELVVELQEKAGARLMLMPTKSFLHHAREHLDVVVSSDTLRQAGRVADRGELQESVDIILIHDVAKLLQEQTKLHQARRDTEAEIRLHQVRLNGLTHMLKDAEHRASPEVEDLKRQISESETAMEDLFTARTRADYLLGVLDQRLANEELAPIVSYLRGESPVEVKLRRLLKKRGLGDGAVKMGPTSAG
jgi:hypothetical protein